MKRAPLMEISIGTDLTKRDSIETIALVWRQEPLVARAERCLEFLARYGVIVPHQVIEAQLRLDRLRLEDVELRSDHQGGDRDADEA